MREGQAAGESVSLRRLWLLRLTWGLLIFTAMYLALEAGYRIYKLQKYGMVDYPDVLAVGYFETHPLYGAVPKKNFSSDDVDPKLKRSTSNVPDFQARVTFNGLGYRGKDFQIKKPPNSLRIVVFGGSTTMGLEVDDHETWPAQLEAYLGRDRDFLLRHRVESVEVINAGVGGWRTREGLLRLQKEVRYFEPDMILVAFNWNDFNHGLDGYDPDEVIEHKRPWWYHSTLLQNLRIRYLRYRATNEGMYKSWIENLREEKPWSKSFVRNILAMQAISREINAELMLVNLPGLCRTKSRASDEYDMIIRNTRVTPENFEFHARLKLFVTELLRKLGHEHGMKVIDVSSYFEAFSGKERLELFTDEMHATPRGSETIAQAVSACLAHNACEFSQQAGARP